MDSLALLCTLHAAGPATRSRLAAAGVLRLEDLAGLDVARLAEAAGVSLSHAARLQREARELAGRGALEPALDARDAPDAAAPREGAELTPQEGAEPALRGAGGAGPAKLASARGDASWSSSPVHRRPSVPGEPERELAPAPAPDPSPVLAPDLVDELDASLVADLARAGVRTLRDLAEAGDLALARRLGQPFTRVLELSLAARRALDAGARRAGDGSGGRAEPRRRRVSDRIGAGGA